MGSVSTLGVAHASQEWQRAAENRALENERNAQYQQYGKSENARNAMNAQLLALGLRPRPKVKMVSCEGCGARHKKNETCEYCGRDE